MPFKLFKKLNHFKQNNCKNIVTFKDKTKRGNKVFKNIIFIGCPLQAKYFPGCCIDI